MFGNRKVDAKYLKASKEHLIIHEHIETFEKILKSDRKDDLFKPLQEALGRLKADMLSHFEIEENVLFPAALSCLASLETSDLVLRFQKEHGYFERDFDRIEEIMAALPESLNSETAERLTCFLSQLKQHALEETHQLYYYMDREKSCQKLIKGIAIPS